MLSQKTITTVKATVPVLLEGGEALTRHFYKRMFAQNPEVLPFFNPAHQRAGAQQKALANAVCAYAANIDNLEVLQSAVELIAQKHASLLVKAEHYPIVGENLLASIQEVLGDAATPDIVEAWREAYGFLADILIKREAQIYEQQQIDIGWQGFKNFEVVRKCKESDVVTSFYLQPQKECVLPQFKPGQYITIRVPFAEHGTTMRNYSLSNKPGQEYLRISVKKEQGKEANIPEGYVSNMLHDQITEGDIVEVAPPCGEFYFDIKSTNEHPIVFLAAGIGITPILSMLLTAVETFPQQKIIFIHANLHEKTQAFQETIDSLDKKYDNLVVHYRYSSPAPEGIVRGNHNTSDGFVDGNLIESLVGQRNANYYFCGPKPFMESMYKILRAWEIDEQQIRFEFFGPKDDLTS